MIKKLWDKFVSWLFNCQKKRVIAKIVIVIVTVMEKFMLMIMVYVLVIIVNVKINELTNTQRIMV